MHSGIQSLRGGVSRYYRGDLGIRLADSTEITGYAIAGFLELNEADAAIRAGDYLIADAWDQHLRLFPFELDPARYVSYFFDSGIIARGLIALWRHTGNEAYLNAAIRAGESMIDDFCAPRGYHPIIDLPSKEPLPYTEWWSRRPGCFQLKAALAWKELAEITGDTRFEEHYLRQVVFSVATMHELISIEQEPLKIMDRLHAYCYFLEGLMPVADRYVGVLETGIAEITDHLHALAPIFARSDVYAQLLRVRLLADRAGLVPLDRSSAATEVEALAEFQLESDDPWLDGSFAFGRREGSIILHANPVSTVFATQALAWFEQYRESSFDVPWTKLI